MNVLELLAGLGLQGRKASASKGGEYHGVCPGCGGNDRFHVWPAQNNGTGSYWCRGCEKKGDNIQFLRDFAGLAFADACRKVGREDLLDTDPAAPRQHRPRRAPLTLPPAPELAPWAPNSYQLPSATWQAQAAKMVEHCHQALLANQAVMDYLAGRGLPRAAVEKNRLGWHEGQGGADHRYSSYAKWGLETPIDDRSGQPKKGLWIPRGIVIPCFDAAGRIIRIRIRRPGEDTARFGNKYHVFPGSWMGTMVLGPRAARAYVIVEAELDGIAVDHAAGDLVGAVPVMTVEGKPDAPAAEQLAASLCILNALDIGDTGGGAQAAARARAWWQGHYPQQELWPAPAGKDPGEAAEQGEDLRLWVLAGLPPVFHLAHGGSSSISDMVPAGGAAVSVAGETAAAATVEEKPEMAAKPFGAVIDEETAVAELGQLLAGCQVKIVKDGHGGLGLKWDQAWRRVNMSVASRISDLVFKSEACGRHIDNHPAQVIKGSNWGKR